MLQTSLLLMKSLNKTETPIFLSIVCSLFPKAIFLTFILLFLSLYVFACISLCIFILDSRLANFGKETVLLAFCL